MKRTIFALSTMVSAFAGGFACNYLVNGYSAAAQQLPRPNAGPRAPVHAQGFILEDANGLKRGELALDENGNSFVKLYDRNGKPTWSSSRSGLLPLNATPESFR